MAPANLNLEADSLLARIRQSTRDCQSRGSAALGRLDRFRPMMTTYGPCVDRMMAVYERNASA